MPCSITFDALRDLYPASDLTFWRRVNTATGPTFERAPFVPTHRIRRRPLASKARAFSHTDFLVLEAGAAVSWGWLPMLAGETVESARPAYALDSRGVWHWLNGPPMVVEASEVRVRGPLRNELLGYVYFIQAGGPGGAIKIGWSSDVSRRLAELQTANAEPLVLLTTTPGTQLTERAFHTRFGAARMTAEWFRPCPELTNTIDEIRKFNEAARGRH